MSARGCALHSKRLPQTFFTFLHPGFVVASGGVSSEEYGHDGPGVCQGDGQTVAEGVSSQGGRGDALLRRMPPDLA